MNVSVVQGHLSRSPEERILPSGDRLVSLEVSVRRPNQSTESVPVAWPDAPKNVTILEPGTEVLVLGRVRRRFFRAGGFTQSRTEVVAESVVPVRHPKKVQALLDKAAARLSE
ncbi:MAG: single-strand DNA-binding protein [Acidimicrobiaceae bacterium]|nr:single-strand DNA-binding protein [Acidimicrobiaceae bacterium]